ncbi:hypothetical protein ACIRU3_39210 [Streptomyces sp. NPDC101151]|uniref:hypothetical protein n=1 Tax=Streptomyces sp. NPDC101151 TaxID=3366115 RepID=UPI00381A7115
MAAAAELRKQPQPTTAEARDAVREAGEEARRRFAERWLGERLARLRAVYSLGNPSSAERTDWRVVLPALAAQGLPEATAGALRERVSV